jgi:hypothetical protein
MRSLDHTQRRTIVGRAPLDKWSARLRDRYLTTHNTHKRQTYMPSVGFQPTLPASERPLTHAIDRAATGIGTWKYRPIWNYRMRCRLFLHRAVYWKWACAGSSSESSAGIRTYRLLDRPKTADSSQGNFRARVQRMLETLGLMPLDTFLETCLRHTPIVM